MIDIDKTELSENNYSEFMDTLDAEIIRQYPNNFPSDYKHSETLTKEQWLLDFYDSTVQDIIDAETECWEPEIDY
jgi:hypothetical protein